MILTNLSMLIVFSIIYISALIAFYLSKKRIDTTENKIYKIMLFTNLVGLVMQALCDLVSIKYDIFSSKITDFILRGYLVTFIVWVNCMLLYLIEITFKDKRKKIFKNATLVFMLFEILLLFVFPYQLFRDDINRIYYTYGTNVEYVYFISFVISMVIGSVLFFNRKQISQKKVLPIYAFLVFGIGVMLIQIIYPQLVITTAMESLICCFMYFTIENPDLKLLEEVHKAKEISDNANEEKTMFLYNMTQEIRNTTNEINDNADMILESENLDESKDYAREIKGITSKFNSMTNEMLDVSKLDSANIKVYNSKYNVKHVLKGIVTVYSKECKIKNVDFRVNIDHDVPEVLYGDSIGLKNVLTTVMDNSVKYTKEGFIEFDINTIIKNDVCRLIITIEDSGIGIKSEDINKMKIDNKSLSKANKLITLMNGTMMISSNYGVGTKVKIILDQKIELNVNEDIAKYDEIYDDIKLLMVDDSDSGIKIIDKLIKGSNIKMDFATNGKECVDKIKAYGKYDIILLDEQLTQISAMELIYKIRSIRNFDIPVILLTKDNSYEYNDEYKNLGFSDYLLKPVKREDLLSKINECRKKD